MSEIANNNQKTLADGGFRIEIRPDELTAASDKSAWLTCKPSAAWRFIRIFILGLIVVALFINALTLTGSTKNGLPLILFISVGSVAMLVNYLRGTNNLYCTRENLEVISLRRGKVIGKWLFPRSVVQQIRWAAVSYSKYGATCAIVFNVEGKKVKTLRGIECPEAQTVLLELKRLGYDVMLDVGMPMMAEMALENRSGKLLG